MHTCKCKGAYYYVQIYMIFFKHIIKKLFILRLYDFVYTHVKAYTYETHNVLLVLW